MEAHKGEAAAGSTKDVTFVPKGVPKKSQPCRLAPCHAQEFLPLGRLSELEAEGMEALKAELRASIQKGTDFVHQGATAANPGGPAPRAPAVEKEKPAGVLGDGLGTGSSSSVGGTVALT